MVDVNLSLLGVSGGGPPASTYVGPGDVVGGWLGWWGVQALSAAVAATGTQKAFNVRRASDNTTTDILILTSGLLDAATAQTFAGTDATGTGAITGTALTFTGGHIGDVVTGGTTLPGTVIVSGTSPAWTVNLSQTVVSTTLTLTWGLFVTKAYDQSGAGKDALEATAAAQPQLLLTGGPSGGPCLRYVSGSSQILTTVGNVVAATGSHAFVAERTANFTSIGPVIAGQAAVGYQSGFANAANKVYAFAGTLVTANATDSVWHACSITFNGAPGNNIYMVDGVQTTVSQSSTPQSGTMSIGGNIGGGQFLSGNFVEGGINSNIFSVGTQTSLNTNMHSRYSF